jgi:hypothetical protein
VLDLTELQAAVLLPLAGVCQLCSCSLAPSLTAGLRGVLPPATWLHLTVAYWLLCWLTRWPRSMAVTILITQSL